MLNNIAIDVVIGLVFVYLLYSLFATVLAEIIAVKLGLRARNLREAVDRMINDEEETRKSFLWRFVDSIRLMKKPDNKRINNFYNHPEIKYLGSTGIFSNPSNFKSVSFSKTLLYLINETGFKKLKGESATIENEDAPDEPITPIDKYQVEVGLKGIIQDHLKLPADEKHDIVLDKQTAGYVLALWNDSYGDLLKFRLLLEAWFDRTMEQATEWYKRKIQIVLLVLGFTLAWLFNADTFDIINKLSTDRDAREQMVRLAASYQQGAAPGAPVLNLPPGKMDSLMKVSSALQADIEKANSILGTGGWLPDAVTVTTDPAGRIMYQPLIDRKALLPEHQAIQKGSITFSTWNKWGYFFRLLRQHFVGFLVTAIAISLGAPFWFDLLNKLMKLRTSVKQDTAAASERADVAVSPVNRVG